MGLILAIWIVSSYVLATMFLLDADSNNKEVTRAEAVLSLLAPVSIPTLFVLVLVGVY